MGRARWGRGARPLAVEPDRAPRRRRKTCAKFPWSVHQAFRRAGLVAERTRRRSPTPHTGGSLAAARGIPSLVVCDAAGGRGRRPRHAAGGRARASLARPHGPADQGRSPPPSSTWPGHREARRLWVRVGRDQEGTGMNILTVKVEKPEATNFILGQSHFIKTVEDIHEAIVAHILPDALRARLLRVVRARARAPLGQRRGARSSSPRAMPSPWAPGTASSCSSRTASRSTSSTRSRRSPRSAGSSARPRIRSRWWWRRAASGRAILGVVDGCSPKGVEGEQDVLARLRFLREIGYKLG